MRRAVFILLMLSLVLVQSEELTLQNLVQQDEKESSRFFQDLDNDELDKKYTDFLDDLGNKLADKWEGKPYQKIENKPENYDAMLNFISDKWYQYAERYTLLADNVADAILDNADVLNKLLQVKQNPDRRRRSTGRWNERVDRWDEMENRWADSTDRWSDNVYRWDEDRWDDNVERWDEDSDRWNVNVERWDEDSDRWEGYIDRWDKDTERWDGIVDRWNDNTDRWDEKSERWDDNSNRWTDLTERWDDDDSANRKEMLEPDEILLKALEEIEAQAKEEKKEKEVAAIEKMKDFVLEDEKEANELMDEMERLGVNIDFGKIY